MTATIHGSAAKLPAAHLGMALAASLLGAGLVAPSGVGARLSVLESDLPAAQGWARKNPNCLEWGDACFICKRGDNGAAKCSTPGIACTSGEIVCKAEKGK